MKYLKNVIVKQDLVFSGLGVEKFVITLHCVKCNNLFSANMTLVNEDIIDRTLMGNVQTTIPKYCPYCDRKLVKENKQ